MEEALLEQRGLTDSLQVQLEQRTGQISELQSQIEVQALNLGQMELEVEKKQGEVTSKEELILRGKSQLGKVMKELEEVKKRLSQVEKAKSELELDRTRLKEDLGELKKVVKEHQHGSLVEKKRLDEKKQEVVALEHQLKRVASAGSKQQKETQGALDSVTQYRRQVKEFGTAQDILCLWLLKQKSI